MNNNIVPIPEMIYSVIVMCLSKKHEVTLNKLQQNILEKAKTK